MSPVRWAALSSGSRTMPRGKSEIVASFEVQFAPWSVERIAEMNVPRVSPEFLRTGSG
jgi:hypothetical protein